MSDCLAIRDKEVLMRQKGSVLTYLLLAMVDSCVDGNGGCNDMEGQHDGSIVMDAEWLLMTKILLQLCRPRQT